MNRPVPEVPARPVVAPEATEPGFSWAWAGTLAATLLLVGVIVAPPFLPPEIRRWVMAGFRVVCHQLPSRSFHIDGVPLAVCHRCLGIYAAMPVAVLAFAWFGAGRPVLDRYAPYVLAASLLPLSIDWLGDVLGWWTNTPASRTITGGLFGLAAGYYLMQAVARAARPSRDAAGYADPGDDGP
ncbi:MAG: DUF2085 domain-containing protein [Bacteroidetes bacterium]|nr:hypothetical protein AWN76_000825 [Rhodothermaceae bacterium RA]RMH53237.1 MAG: DUF2085 domain-containing protein [Bacteroidota bacterium]